MHERSIVVRSPHCGVGFVYGELDHSAGEHVLPHYGDVLVAVGTALLLQVTESGTYLVKRGSRRRARLQRDELLTPLPPDGGMVRVAGDEVKVAY